MKKVIIPATYDDKPVTIYSKILENNEKIGVDTTDAISIFVINYYSSDEIFIIDDDIYEINKEVLYSYLDTSKKYILCEYNSNMEIVEYSEDRLKELLYILSGLGVEFRFAECNLINNSNNSNNFITLKSFI